MKVVANFSLKGLNTFGLDAKSRFYTQITSVSELFELLKTHSKENILILGGGSNMLFTKTFEGLIVHNCIKGIEILNENDNHIFLKAGAGEVWHDLVLFCINRGLGGIENLSLIPGTVGAAPIQNIGAYGVELKDVFHSLEAIELQTGRLISLKKDQCEFGYRDSVFKREYKGKYIITSVTFALSKEPVFNTSYGAIETTMKELGYSTPSIKAISDAVVHIRRSKLPDPAKIGNAGSFFKNPEIPVSKYNELKLKYPDLPSYPTHPGMVKIPAGWLNEKAGWKGKRIGDAGVHKDQALVLVNYGHATGNELKELAIAIQKSIREQFGIELEMEVNLI